MAILTVNGVAMPAPSALSVAVEDVGDDAGRNALGERVVDRVAVKRMIALRWARLTASQLATILQAVTAAVLVWACVANAACMAGLVRVAMAICRNMLLCNSNARFCKAARVARPSGGAAALVRKLLPMQLMKLKSSLPKKKETGKSVRQKLKEKNVLKFLRQMPLPFMEKTKLK